MIEKFPVGTRIRFNKRIDRFDFFSVPAGTTGTITVHHDHFGLYAEVKMDQHIPGAEYWENNICFYHDNISEMYESCEVIQPKPIMSLPELAKQAIDIQDASSLSGLVHSWSEVVTRLHQLLPDLDTDSFNQHPINVLWADKLASLTGIQTRYGPSYNWCSLEAAKLGK